MRVALCQFKGMFPAFTLVAIKAPGMDRHSAPGKYGTHGATNLLSER